MDTSITESFKSLDTLEVRKFISFLDDIDTELNICSENEEKVLRNLTSSKSNLKEVNSILQELKLKKKNAMKELYVLAEEVEMVENELESALTTYTEERKEICDLETVSQKRKDFKINIADKETLEITSLKVLALKNLFGVSFFWKRCNDNILNGVVYNANNDHYINPFTFDLSKMTVEEIKKKLWEQIEKGCSTASLDMLRDLLTGTEIVEMKEAK